MISPATSHEAVMSSIANEISHPWPTRNRRLACRERDDDTPLQPPHEAAIWSPEARFRSGFEIEAHATSALAEIGSLPRGGRARCLARRGDEAVFDVERIERSSARSSTTFIAFLTHLAEIVGPEARFVHAG